jgi:hypothetical protein
VSRDARANAESAGAARQAVIKKPSPWHGHGVSPARSLQRYDIEFSGERKRVRCNEGRTGRTFTRRAYLTRVARTKPEAAGPT